MSKEEQFSVCGQWTTIETDIDGNVVSFHESENILVNVGKAQLLSLAFVSGATGTFTFVAVGSSTVAATVTDTHLGYELTANPNRKTLTSNFTGNVGNPLSAVDITANTITIGSNTYTYQLIGQCQFSTSDGNNGANFGEYALFTTATNPSTPTGVSGIMFNHYIDPANLAKTSSNNIQTVFTLRF